MAINLAALKAQLNILDDVDDALIQQKLDAAGAHIAATLGFALDDDDQFPDGTPADLDQAVLMLAAYWYEQRETALVDSRAAGVDVPFGVDAIVANYRSYSFGLPNA